MPEPVVRLASPADAEAMLGIYAWYVENTAVTFEYKSPTPEEFRRRVTETLKKYPWVCLEDEGQVCGYAYASAFRTRAAYAWSAETSIYLDRDRQGRGWGRLLYGRLEEYCRSMGLQALFACITSPRGEDPYVTDRSLRFHRRAAYEPAGLLPFCGCKFGRWYDTAYMVKHLGDHPASPPQVVPFPELKTI